METTIGTCRNNRSRGHFIAQLNIAVLVALLAGCASNSLVDKEDRVFTRVYTPQVPEFLSGPAGALLTNATGFSARATFESRTPVAPNGVEITEGELLSRGTRLLFAPRSIEGAPKEVELGGFSFIWDVATGSGYVLSEALQGYTPVVSSVKAAKVVLQPGTTRGEESAVVGLDNGSSWLFQVWRTADAKAPPSRISSVTNAPPFTLKIAKLRHEPPPENLFAPPDGFAKYASPEALADELAARKSGIRRGAYSEMERRYMQGK